MRLCSVLRDTVVILSIRWRRTSSGGAPRVEMAGRAWGSAEPHEQREVLALGRLGWTLHVSAARRPREFPMVSAGGVPRARMR